jgi:S-adenosylmethionine:tRNA ribosyltransferase-isomerase
LIDPKNIKSIQIEDFDFPLDDRQIAKYPLEKRDESKLLCYNGGVIEDKQFKDLPELLPENSFLVFNNTKVIQARLRFAKSTGAAIEIFCLEPYYPNDYAMAFAQRKFVQWECMIGNARKWKSGALEMLVCIDKDEIKLSATKLKIEGADHIVGFTWDNEDYAFSQILEAAGSIPIPPYLNRESEDEDTVRYQTIYSKTDGSVAAPTAGLHFTEDVFSRLALKGIKRGELTLHVGAGTFKPVSSETIGEHDMHTEHFYVTKTFLRLLIQNQDHTIAVGTTSVRTLETLYWLGVKLMTVSGDERVKLSMSQWEVYDLPDHYTSDEALRALFEFMVSRKLEFLHSATQIILLPGYKFKIVKGLVTNYHLPKSTLLLLVSALVGNDWKKIYEHALNGNYRFLSYGDSSLLMANDH